VLDSMWRRDKANGISGSPPCGVVAASVDVIRFFRPIHPRIEDVRPPGSPDADSVSLMNRP
jgi:hypothetical protein